MINILFPMAGRSRFFKDSFFPLPLIEIGDKTIIQLVIDNYRALSPTSRFLFIIRRDDQERFHLADVLRILAGEESRVILTDGETRGAACSSLLAVDCIDTDDPLVIANSDQVIDEHLGRVIEHFSETACDAGVLCFESVHPRWSYVRTDQNNTVIETAEKRPLSKNAIAGLYFFRRGSDFVTAAKAHILKGCTTNRQYYVAPVLNELILDGKKVGIYRLRNALFHTLYSPQKIEEYEQWLGKKAGGENGKKS